MARPWSLVVSIVFEAVFIAILGLWWLALLPHMLRRIWWSLSQSCSRWRRQTAGSVDETQKRIAKHMALKRLERLKLIAGPALFPIPALTLYSLAQALQNALQWNGTLADNSIVGLNFEGIAISLVTLFAVTFPQRADRVLTLPKLDILMMLLFLSVGAHTWPAADAAMNYTNALNQSITVQMVLAMCMGGGFKVGLVNVINLVLQLLLNYIPVPRKHHVPEVCPFYERNMVYRLVWNALFTQLVSIMTTQVLRAEAQAMIGEMEASRSQTTATDLLSVMCDAVVALRKDFSFRGDCNRFFACLMMRDRPVRMDLTQTLFLKYVSDDGQERFKELIETQEGAGTFHMHLIDSLRRKVPVQVFHTKWIDADNEVNYLLGIQEEGEVDHYPSVSTLPELDKRRVPADAAPEDAVPSERSSLSEGRGTRSSISAVSGWESTGVSCLLRLSLQTEVLRQSDECLAMFNFGNNLLSHLDEDAQTQFVDWLRALYASKARRGMRRFGETNVRSSTGIAYKAIMNATFATNEEVFPVEPQPADTVLQLNFLAPRLGKTPTEKELVQAVLRRSPEQRRRLQARAGSLPAARRIMGQSISDLASESSVGL